MPLTEQTIQEAFGIATAEVRDGTMTPMELSPWRDLLEERLDVLRPVLKANSYIKHHHGTYGDVCDFYFDENWFLTTNKRIVEGTLDSFEKQMRLSWGISCVTMERLVPIKLIESDETVTEYCCYE
eukprot:TRINITY_DN2390_c0_g1_i4.p1 TRINITY_DN2390_c0_g1~~TRINITY_DN2390_c0_g1_i4.p1  ORF type:complete len:126 (-),score=1.02 TRINITY_DN2390_c0_g1_i4:55-432(-)